MRRKKSSKRGRIIPVLAAGLIGYLIGGWQPVALRTTGESNPAASIAQRFPENWQTASAASATAIPMQPVPGASAAAQRDAALALLSPEPMAPQLHPQPAPATAQEAGPAPAVQTAAQYVASAPMLVPGPQAAEPRQIRQPSATPRLASAAKPPAVHRTPERPGYLLDEAQIASIKTRLNLTPDQERMWPAVEAALRNVAYTRTQQARSQGYAASPSQLASVDPESVEGLKSAATPLILSFNEEQKEEVRNLAHVMGLDQLASQF
jgi:hypothetical protein